MPDETSSFLYNLLGWLGILICVLLGLSKAGPHGLFRCLWVLVCLGFALRLADSLAVWAGDLVGGPLGLVGAHAQIAGYWAAFGAAMIVGIVWLKLTGETKVDFPPLLEQVGAPVLGAAAGLLVALAGVQTLLISDWVREKFPSATGVVRSALVASGQTWFPDNVPVEPTDPAPAGESAAPGANGVSRAGDATGIVVP
jgi:hypothetical protein